MSKEARHANRGRWLKRLSWIFGSVAVIAVIFGLRHLNTDQAHGQTQQVRTANNTKNGPASSTKRAVPAPNGVAAVVDGEQITRKQLAFECMRRFGEDVLSGMITTYLVQQETTQRGIRVTDQEVNDEIKRVAESFGLSATHWITLLETDRDVPEAKYRREIIWPQLALHALASDRVKIVDAEVKELFDARFGPKVKTRVIVTESRTKAEQLHQVVTQNPDVFPQVAKDHSEDAGSAAARGLIPPIGRNMGSPELETAAFALRPGEISNIVKVADQYFVIKCEAIIPNQFISAKQLPIIQKQIREQVRSRKINEAAIEISADLERRAEIIRVYGNADLTQKYPDTAALINGRAITLEQLANECFDRHANVVLEGEIHRTILRHELAKRKITVNQKDLDQEIRRAAESYGFVSKGEVDVDGWLEQAKIQYLSLEVYIRDSVWPSVALKKLTNGKVEVPEEDMRKGFEAHYGKRVEVLAIVMKNERKALEVWESANGNRTEQFFGELASTYSIEPTSRGNFGRVPPIRRHGGSKAIEEEAFKLKAGELSGLIGTGDTYVILYCLGRTDPVVSSIDEVRDELHEELFERALRIKMGKEMQRMLTDAKTQSFIPGRRVVKKTSPKVRKS